MAEQVEKGQDPAPEAGEEKVDAKAAAKEAEAADNARRYWAQLRELKGDRDKRKKFKARVKKRSEKETGWAGLSLDERIRLAADVVNSAQWVDYGGPQCLSCTEKMLIKDKKKEFADKTAAGADGGG